MARPLGTPNPQARNRRPRRPDNRENLASLTSKVHRLRLQAHILPITGSKPQLVIKRLQNAFQSSVKNACKETHFVNLSNKCCQKIFYATMFSAHLQPMISV